MRLSRSFAPVSTGLLLSAALLSAPAVWAAPPDHGPDHDRDTRGQSAQHETGHAPSAHDNGHQQQEQHSQDHHAQEQARYNFRDSDRGQLQRHYKSVLGHVDRAHRPEFRAGERIPDNYRRAITPAPQSVRRRLQAPPAGYTVGYYQGYTVVYDPTTYLVLSVIDLLTQ